MEQYTPMMQQYLEVKKNYQDALVFYRLGDFYEMFFEDAKIASCELDLVLTGRNAGVKDRVPMCGVPFHAVTGYIQRLVQKGYKVAIVEQMEDPALAKGLVKRDVIKVVTPGTVIDELFDERSSIYLAAVVDYQYGFALSICEMSTGETTVTHIPRNILHLQQTLLKNNIREIVVKEGFDEKFIRGSPRSVRRGDFLLCRRPDRRGIPAAVRGSERRGAAGSLRADAQLPDRNADADDASSPDCRN